MILPTLIATKLPIFRGEIEAEENTEKRSKNSAFMLILGLGLIVFVPIFKTITHLPPYIGMMLFPWINVIDRRNSNQQKVQHVKG